MMRRYIYALITIFLIIFTPLSVYSLNPQIYYKSIYIYGSENHISPVVELLNEIMLLDSNVKTINEIDSKNILTAVDILIYVPEGNEVSGRDMDFISEWILLGGKLLIVFSPESKEYEDIANNVLKSIGSSIRFRQFNSDFRRMYEFKLFGSVSEYMFDPDINDLKVNLSLSSLVYVSKAEYQMGSGGIVYVGDDTVPWIITEYLAAYSDLFTWYYSKIIALAFPSDELVNTQEFELLFTELLSWGITPYLNPNSYSIALTLLTGFGAVAAYVSIRFYK